MKAKLFRAPRSAGRGSVTHGNAAAALIALAIFGVAADATAATCESLAQVSLQYTTITSATSIPAGTFVLPNGMQLPNLPESCRVTGVIKPSSDSNILFEVWLPKAAWNSRLQQVGNGGLAGSLTILYATVPSALQRGYVVAGTDDGHQASGIDGSWAIGHPEKVKDFGYRAVHLTNVNAKAITQAFYTTAPRIRTSTLARKAAAKRTWKRSVFPRTSTASSSVRRRTSGPISW